MITLILSINVSYRCFLFVERSATILLECLNKLKDKYSETSTTTINDKEDCKPSQNSLTSAYDIVNQELIKKLKTLQEDIEVQLKNRIKVKKQILRQELWLKIRVCYLYLFSR